MNVSDVDVDQIDIEADDLSNSDDTYADPDEENDAGIFSIANDYTSEMKTPSLKDDLLAVRTRRNGTN